MIDLKTLALAAIVAAGTSTVADAAPFGAAIAAAPAPLQVAPVQYGPYRYGLYGSRQRFRDRRSYGTGYHGRGTRTGGPSGGLPGRS